MEYDKIKELIQDMGNSKLSSIEISFADGTKINMKKENNIEKSFLEPKLELQKEIRKENRGQIIKSPMVGTFYLKPSPTSNPYVEIGKEIEKGETVCIIEAMKLMNEIESEYNGKITKIFVNDGESVEYGTELFEIE